MGMTARMVVMMTPQDKRAIEQRARTQKLTPSELMRRAAHDYDPVPDEEALTLIAETVEQAAANMARNLDEAITYSRQRMAEIDAIRAEHEANMARLRHERA